MVNIERIAIIGGGVAGISLLNGIVNHRAYNHASIDVYDSADMMGRGQAYVHDSDHLLLNVSVENMSLTGDPDHFVNWLRAHQHPVEKYVARRRFGEYAVAILESLADLYDVTLKNSYVNDITINSDGSYTVYSNDGDKIYDAIFLTPGQLDYNDPYDLNGIDNYIHDPYPVQKKLAGSKGRAGIIGNGLSGIDCIRYLILERAHHPLYVFSRDGDMPSVQGNVNDLELKHFTAGNIKSGMVNGLVPLEYIVDTFEKELDAHGVPKDLMGRQTDNPYHDIKFDLAHSEEVGRLQELIVKINPFFSEVFKYLSKEDKDIFMEKYHPLIDENHSPMPRAVAEELVKWMEEGRIIIHEGMEAVSVEECFKVKTTDGIYDIDVLINATGPRKSPEASNNPLIRNLVDRFIIIGSRYGGLLVNQNRQVVSPRYGTLSNVYAIGALTIGADYLSNSVEILIRNTGKIVDDFYA